MSKVTKRKRNKTVSLSLEDVLTSSVADEMQTLEKLNKLHGQLAEVDLVGVVDRKAALMRW